MEPVSIYEWVSEHNPSPGLSYGKGWWDYVTFLYHLDELYGSNRTTVVSTYELATPPPQETLLMPVARLETDRAVFIMKAQFDGIEPAWTVSVIRDGAGRIPLYGLIDEEEESAADAIDGFAAEWVFPCYAKSPDRFTARIEDDWQLYAFVWVIAHSGAGTGRSAHHA
jgi:hypothetical protein